MNNNIVIDENLQNWFKLYDNAVLGIERAQQILANPSPYHNIDFWEKSLRDWQTMKESYQKAIAATCMTMEEKE